MWMPIWTLSAELMHFVTAFQLDGNAAKVSILFMVPLALQLRTGAAKVCSLQQQAGQKRSLDLVFKQLRSQLHIGMV